MPSANPFLAVVKLVIYVAVARLFPARSWGAIAHALATLSALFLRGRRRREIGQIEAVLNRSLTKDELPVVAAARSAGAFLTGFIVIGQKYAKGRS